MLRHIRYSEWTSPRAWSFQPLTQFFIGRAELICILFRFLETFNFEKFSIKQRFKKNKDHHFTTVTKQKLSKKCTNQPEPPGKFPVKQRQTKPEKIGDHPWSYKKTLKNFGTVKFWYNIIHFPLYLTKWRNTDPSIKNAVFAFLNHQSQAESFQ